MLLSPLRRKSSKCSSRELMNQENVDKARPYKRERKKSILGSIFRTTSSRAQDDDDSMDIVSSSPPRPITPKAFHFNRNARGKQRILETVDQNTTDIVPDVEELEDIDDEEFEGEIIPVPYVDEEETLDLISPPAPKILQSNVIVNSELRRDSRLSLELKSGPYYEVWDPRVSDQFAIMGRVTYQPHLPSVTTPQLSHLIYLSIEAFMQCPRKPINALTGKGQTDFKYLKLVENSTILEPGMPPSTDSKERNPDKKTIETTLAQAQPRQAISPILDFLSSHSTIDLQVKPIVWVRGTQVCMFKLTLPVADPFLFLDNGAGDVVRTLKVRSRGVIRVVEDGRVTVNECVVEENIVVDVLKMTVLIGM